MVSLEIDIQRLHIKNGISFTVQIVTQRLRGGRANFQASNGFYFSSLSCPAIGGAYNRGDSNSRPMMYLRGSARDADNEILYTNSVGYIEKLKAAVIEYNIAKECLS